MAKEFNGKYIKTKEIGKMGTKTVELGHYIMDGKEYADKIYIIDHYTKRNGESESRNVAKFTIEEFNALKGMEV